MQASQFTRSTTAPHLSVKRPWYRLHLSTCFVSATQLALLVLIVVRGEHLGGGGGIMCGPGGCIFLDGQYYAHGWPWTYLERGTRSSTHEASKSWLLGEGVEAFHMGALVSDIVAALALMATTLAAFEAWRRRHARFRFTLRELLALTTIIALVLAWLRLQQATAHEEAQAIKRLEQQEIFYAYQEYVGPLWLRRLAGPLPIFDRVTEIGSESPMDDHIARLGDELHHFRHLKKLDLGDDGAERWYEGELTEPASGITNQGILALRFPPQLVTLDLSGTRVTDASVAQLRSLRSLESLDLSETAISDAALAHLCGLPKLATLNLTSTKVTGRGILQLHRLRSLKTLHLSDTNVDDAIAALEASRPDMTITR